MISSDSVIEHYFIFGIVKVGWFRPSEVDHLVDKSPLAECLQFNGEMYEREGGKDSQLRPTRQRTVYRHYTPRGLLRLYKILIKTTTTI